MYFVGKLAWFAYELVLLLAWPVLYFYYFCRAQTDGKYRTNYRARMGLDLPGPFRNGSGRVWFHALSLGETLSSIPLILEINKQKPSLEIVFSTATETGMVFARERLSHVVSTFFFMPHDFPWTVQKLVKRVRPALFVLIETDSWPNLLCRLRHENVFAALVNGRISPGSYRRYLRMAGLAGMIFNGFDLVFTQTDLDRARFEFLRDLAGKVIAAGNLKFESSGRRTPEVEVRLFRSEIGLEQGRSVWIAGSTHEGEEEIVLRVHRQLITRIPNLLLMIAPRNVARRNELEALCTSFGLTAGVRSRGDSVSGKAVYLIDTLGELARIYALADIAFVGGSLVPSGGHNPLEPIMQRKPVCWGPHFFNFHEIEKALLTTGCAARISCEDELGHILRRFFEDARERAKVIEAVENLAGLQQGTAARIASALLGRSHPGP